jgi:glyoxylate reductase
MLQLRKKEKGRSNMTKPYVFITRKLPDEVVEPLSTLAHIEMWPSEDEVVPRDLLLEQAAQANGLLTMLSDQIDEELFEIAPKLQVVANLAVGYDNIDVIAARKRGIIVCNTPDVLTETTADLTFALLMTTARRIVEADRYVREGHWKSWSPLLLAGTDIHHKTIGIFGMGKIGEAVAHRAKGFHMNILYHNRKRNEQAEQQLGAIYCSFEELLSESDFVVCLAPLTEQTKGMFNYDAFRRMKRSAIFINAGRGPIVVEQDLIRALKEKEIRGAGLDVFEKEPIDEHHPLLSFPTVVALPHIGSATEETRYGMMQLAVENIMAVLSGKSPKTPVK